MGALRKTLFAVSATVALGLAVPAQAQLYSEGYRFLQAVEDALKGESSDTVTEMLAVPGATVVNARDLTTGHTAMHLAIEARNGVWVDYLYQKGANVNLADNEGETPLMLAVESLYIEGVEKLIAHGARVEVANNTGETPLIYAVHARNTELIRLLLQAGANPDRADHSGRSARDYARLRGPNDAALDAITRNERPASPRGGATYGPSF